MTAFNHQKNTPNPPPQVKPVSVHRAFVYSACAPGWGDIYAGSRLRGYATFSIFLFFMVWFTWLAAQTLRTVMGQLFDSLNSMAPFVMPQLPLATIGISFCGIYFTWLWSMLSAVDTAAARRRQTGQSSQAKVGWAVAISWLCPGSGQIYTADRRFGFMLFSAYLLGIFLLIPPYQEMFSGLSDLARNGQLPANNPYSVIGIVHDLIAGVNYSFGMVLRESTKYWALAATMSALRQGPLRAETNWLRPNLGSVLMLIGLGWLCPGSGQLLQGRKRLGWGFFAGYFGCKWLIALLLGAALIAVEDADKLAWLSVAVQCVAMFEAPFALWIGKSR